MKFKKNMTPAKVLQMALEHEKEALDFYKLASEQAEFDSTKKMFAHLCEEEKRHQDMIQDEIDKAFYKEM